MEERRQGSGRRDKPSDRRANSNSRNDRKQPRPKSPRGDRKENSSQSKPGERPRRPSRPSSTGGANRSAQSFQKTRERDEEKPKRLEPEIPQEIYREELDPQLVRELSSLAADNAEQTARHLLAIVHFLGEDPERAHAHGVAASTRAGRVGRVRELAGIAAYNAGKFDVALRELKTAFRITGDPTFWPMMADAQRGLGEPLKALEMGKAPEVKLLDKDGQVELRIVLSGARKDLGEFDAAITAVDCKELQEENPFWSARLRYAYADALASAGKNELAKKWFAKASSVDIDQETDSQERIKKLSSLN
jgi:tetratricopeptide (TPR) repeat protein